MYKLNLFLPLAILLSLATAADSQIILTYSESQQNKYRSPKIVDPKIFDSLVVPEAEFLVKIPTTYKHDTGVMYLVNHIYRTMPDTSSKNIENIDEYTKKEKQQTKKILLDSMNKLVPGMTYRAVVYKVQITEGLYNLALFAQRQKAILPGLIGLHFLRDQNILKKELSYITFNYIKEPADMINYETSTVYNGTEESSTINPVCRDYMKEYEKFVLFYPIK